MPLEFGMCYDKDLSVTPNNYQREYDPLLEFLEGLREVFKTPTPPLHPRKRKSSMGGERTGSIFWNNIYDIIYT